jgi:hypothetical protein
VRDLKLIKVSDDGLVSFAFTGEEASGLDLILQQVCVRLHSDSREFAWGRFVGGDLEGLAAYADDVEFSVEMSSRLGSIRDQMKTSHPDLKAVSLDGCERVGGTMRVAITLTTDYGRRRVKLPIGA